MSSHKSRIEKLEAKEQAQPLTWQRFIDMDPETFQNLYDNDPRIKAAWSEFVADMKPSEIISQIDELIAQGVQPTDDQRAAIESMRLTIHEQP
jgi:hypothetical protein